MSKILEIDENHFNAMLNQGLWADNEFQLLDALFRPEEAEKMSQLLDLTKTCPCEGWKASILSLRNIETAAKSIKGKIYTGNKLTHCPWCGRALKHFSSAEG